MEKKLISVLVRNSIKDGYRRAGFSLQKGDNHLENISERQLVALQQDARLSVVLRESQTQQGGGEGIPKNGQGATSQQNLDDTPASPADLTVPQLKVELESRGIEFAKEAKKDELVALVTEARTQANANKTESDGKDE